MATERASHSPLIQDEAETGEPTPRLFTVDEYYKMAEAGILGPDERVELIEGVIVSMPPIGPRHSFTVSRLNLLLVTRLGERMYLVVQGPVRLKRRVEPEPDFALCRVDGSRRRRYESAHPGPSDVLLVIEVAETTLQYDLGDKARMYARYGVPELWVLDKLGDRLVVHRQPTSAGYADVTVVERGATVSPLAFSDVTFTVDEILG
jgi:Uma2 family endonuclease